MNIKKIITKINFNKLNNRQIKYIVIHYDGNDGATASGNCNYFQLINRDSSAHYFVDENEICQCVEDSDVAWHSGKDYSNGKAKYWNIATNNNSIGIELCSRKNLNKFYIPQKTQDNAIELVQELMKKYNIPIENVVRHYDVTGKKCPAPFVDDYDSWIRFKEKIASSDVMNAIDVLHKNGIIDSPDFWKINYNTIDGVKYFKDLIIKFAKFIEQ